MLHFQVIVLVICEMVFIVSTVISVKTLLTDLTPINIVELINNDSNYIFKARSGAGGGMFREVMIDGDHSTGITDEILRCLNKPGTRSIISLTQTFVEGCRWTNSQWRAILGYIHLTPDKTPTKNDMDDMYYHAMHKAYESFGIKKRKGVAEYLSDVKYLFKEDDRCPPKEILVDPQIERFIQPARIGELKKIFTNVMEPYDKWGYLAIVQYMQNLNKCVYHAGCIALGVQNH